MVVASRKEMAMAEVEGRQAAARAQVVLTQSSPEIKKPGEPTKLTSTVSGFALSSHGMSWVRQAPGRGLEWLIYYYSSSSNSYSPAVQGRFTASKDSSSVCLTGAA
ncbi:unnamed protein product [Lepidochelys olivacea]